MKASKFENRIKKCPNCRNISQRKQTNFLGKSHFACFECDNLLIDNEEIKACDKKKVKHEKNEEMVKSRKTFVGQQNLHWTLIIVFCITLMIASLAYCLVNKPHKTQKKNEIEKEILYLKKYYPSQKNETWFHILSAFNMSTPSVKSIILLHNEDNKTCNCLRQQLVSLYLGGQNISMKDITFENANEIKDYGEALEYYKPLIKKHRIFVTNLQEVSGNIARIFHSLCDDFSSDIKPAVFIFTLQYDNSMGNLMPLTRVSKILRTAWRDIAENEIWPLLSRIVRNVVEIVPETDISC